MTVQKPEDYQTGLEDFDQKDAVVPRLKIIHKEAVFEDTLSKERFDSLQLIILGLVKQRILWHTQVGNDDAPMCRSANFSTGFPNVDEDTPRDKRFPWARSGFERQEPGEDGKIRLPCESCALKEWGSHPDGKRPYCSEQWTLPVMYNGDLTTEDIKRLEADGELMSEPWMPAILTIQKTGIKPLRSYFTSFARSGNPTFTVTTEATLRLQQAGTTDYSVPTFRKTGSTPQENYLEYSQQLTQMRSFLQQDPGSRFTNDDNPAPSDNVNRPDTSTRQDPWATEETPAEAPAPAAPPKAPSKPATPPKAAAPTPPPAPAPADDDDDLPF
jgi:hypothetical protein